MELEQVGVVTKMAKDRVEIEVKRISGCGGGCKTCSGCDTPGHTLILKNSVGAKVGDMVKIKGQTHNFLKYTFVVYLIPLATLLIGLFGGIQIFKSMGFKAYEIAGFVTGAITLAMGYGLVKKIDRKIAEKDEQFIRIIEIL